MVLFKYSASTWFVLLGMIISGSARSIVVKLAYQSGFKAPLTVTLLSFLGKSLSFFVYWIPRLLAKDNYDALPNAKVVAKLANTNNEGCGLELGENGIIANDDDDAGDAENNINSNSEKQQYQDDTNHPHPQTTTTTLNDNENQNEIPDSKWSSILDFYTIALRGFITDEDDTTLNGSNHGLSHESETRIRWVHRVPQYVKPAIPAILNLLASALRWTSLVYIDASVVEMMVAGLELTLSVVAARIFRKRMVAKSRWAGVVIVAAGVIIIERGSSSASIEKHGAQDVMIGVILIVIQSILSVFQDLSEELFMQASGSEVPATMMLGVEGFYGFIVGAIIYSAAANQLRSIEDIDATFSILSQNTTLCWWLIGLPAIFLVTGVFNIKATERTSAMTRNVWKTLRTVLVWVVALMVFYIGNNPALGEAWHTPESFVILFGFIVMSAGIIAYYSFP